MRRILGLLFMLFVTLLMGEIKAQNFYALDTIQKIEISFTQSNWDYILDTAKQGSDSYTLSKWVKINGVQFDSAGVKYKGNSSYNPNNNKNPLHIELDHFKSQDYLGYKDIKLSNGYNEPSFVREIMLYEMFQKYAEASHANFAQVYINGQYFGVYTNVEAVTNTFLDDRFFSNNNTFVFGDNGGCDLGYKGNDSTKYYQPYTMKSTFGYADLMHLCDSLANNIPGIENILDVDRTLWYLAYCNATVTLDSYLGNSRHNYYIYEDHNDRFNPIIWDLNGGLGIFAKLDFSGNLTIPQMQNLTPLAHANDSMWPLVKKILAVPMYKRMYIAHMKTLMSENFANNSYVTLANQLRTLIDTAVQSDPYKFGTYQQFLDNLNLTVVLGPKTVPGITQLMAARNTYLNSTPEFQAVAPAISNIQSSDTFPNLNTNVYITASVSGATAVYLGRRNSVMDRFYRYAMYDDGLHGDGTAADGVYGVQVLVNAPQVQYYIYAENGNAGVFSPARAEHEYYILNSNYATIQPGQLVINEIQPVNVTTVQNGAGIYADWIELYNNSSVPLSLDFLNLSDNPQNSAKWQFPSGITVNPGQYQIVWADESTGAGEVHCSFKLSGTGEKLTLSYANGVLLDSITFPAVAADSTYGRFPNGAGPFTVMGSTFNAVNTLAGITDWVDPTSVIVYPNPSKAEFQVHSSKFHIKEVVVFDVYGREVFRSPHVHLQRLQLNLARLTPGHYRFQLITNGGTVEKGVVKY